MSQQLFDLTGKVALVTGATHGLGMAMTVALARAGATVVVNDAVQEKLDNAVVKYTEQGVKAHAYRFDVTKENEVVPALDLIEKEVGPIHILVNNAGIIRRTPIVEMAVEEYELVLKVDLTGPFVMGKNVAKRMIARGKGGKIINICSMMSELGRETVSAYASAKGGLKMLTRSMATEWAQYNIQANGIGPGYFATEQTAPIRENGHPFNEFILKRTPAARWGVPEDLAGPAVFLASDASNFVNGHVLYVDGGILATLGKAMNE